MTRAWELLLSLDTLLWGHARPERTLGRLRRLLKRRELLDDLEDLEDREEETDTVERDLGRLLGTEYSDDSRLELRDKSLGSRYWEQLLALRRMPPLFLLLLLWEELLDLYE